MSLGRVALRERAEKNLTRFNCISVHQEVARRICDVICHFALHGGLNSQSEAQLTSFEIAVGLPSTHRRRSIFMSVTDFVGGGVKTDMLLRVYEHLKNVTNASHETLEIQIISLPKNSTELNITFNLQERLAGLPNWVSVFSPPKFPALEEVRAEVAQVFVEEEKLEPVAKNLDAAINFSEMKTNGNDFCFPRIEKNFAKNGIFTCAQLVQALGKAGMEVWNDKQVMELWRWRNFIQGLGGGQWEVNRINRGAALSLKVWLEKKGLLRVI